MTRYILGALLFLLPQQKIDTYRIVSCIFTHKYDVDFRVMVEPQFAYLQPDFFKLNRNICALSLELGSK